MKAKSHIAYQCYSPDINIQDNLIINYDLVLAKSKTLVNDVSFLSFLVIFNFKIFISILLSPIIFPIKTYGPPWNSPQVFSLSRICMIRVFFWEKNSLEISLIIMKWDIGLAGLQVAQAQGSGQGNKNSDLLSDMQTHFTTNKPILTANYCQPRVTSSRLWFSCTSL